MIFWAAADTILRRQSRLRDNIAPNPPRLTKERPRMIVLETQRLRLRHLATDDAPFMLELMNDPGYIRNIGDRQVRTLEQASQYVLRHPVASYEQYGFGLYLVESKLSGGGLGICGLLRRDCHPDVEVGFAFLPAARGQNYAFESARAVIDYGASSLRLERIVALAAPDNTPSIRVLEKLGFRFDRIVQWTAPGRGSRLFVLEQ